MTPYQKLQHLILSKAAMRGEIELGEVTPENIDDLWDEYEERAKRTIAKAEAALELLQVDANVTKREELQCTD